MQQTSPDTNGVGSRRTDGTWAHSMAYVIVFGFMSAGLGSVAYGGDEVLVIAEGQSISSVIAEMAKAEEVSSRWQLRIQPDCGHLEQFVSGQCQVLAWSDYPSTLTGSEWIYGFGRKTLEPTAVCVGQARLAVIVNSANPVGGLSVGQIQKAVMDAGKELDWAKIGGSGG